LQSSSFGAPDTST